MGDNKHIHDMCNSVVDSTSAVLQQHLQDTIPVAGSNAGSCINICVLLVGKLLPFVNPGVVCITFFLCSSVWIDRGSCTHLLATGDG